MQQLSLPGLPTRDSCISALSPQATQGSDEALQLVCQQGSGESNHFARGTLGSRKMAELVQASTSHLAA